MRQWTLCDHAAGVWVETVDLGPAELGMPDCRITKRRLRGGLSDGVDLVQVTCGELSVAILPTRGMGLWRGSYRGLDLGWQAPVHGPVHPSHVVTGERGGLGWLRGFDEWVVRCGLDNNGAPGPDTVLDNNGNPITVQLDLHGRIANTPAHYVSVTADPAQEVLQVTGHVAESALFHPLLELQTTISVTPGSSRITIADTVINRQVVPAELELLYHCNFGPPFLAEGSRVAVPYHAMAPRDKRAAEGLGGDPDTASVRATTSLAPTAGYIEQCYFFRPAALPEDGASLAALIAPDLSRAAVVRFDCRQLPCLTLWKNTAATEQGYVIGIEPATNYPNTRAVERAAGRVVNLEPGARHGAQVMLEVALGEEQVAGVAAEIGQIHDTASKTTHVQPHADFGPT
ncbi:MAG: aldose 1-epimerase family protein [Spirochaetaceae bacterium]|nr:aldose 1-epimerase family protein [Spirochaetaceae bacterium]